MQLKIKILKGFIVSGLFFSFIVLVLSKSDSFRKSNLYSEDAVLISSKLTRSNLECMTVCAKDEQCSMVTMASARNTRLYACNSYQVTIRNNNQDVSNQSDFKVWYKTTPSTCPSPFVQLDSGCYYAEDHDGTYWNDAAHHCKSLAGQSELAVFDDVNVSEALFVITDYYYCV